MKKQKLTITINKPLSEVFAFCITPPKAKLWVPNVIDEKTNEWPVKIGTVYTEFLSNSSSFNIIVRNIKELEFIEWQSENKNYRVKYSFKVIDEQTTELEYYEWAEKGELDNPFTQDILEKLKKAVEESRIDIDIRHITNNEQSQLDAVYSKTIQEQFPEFSPKLRKHFTSGTYKKNMFSHNYLIGAFIENNLVGYLIATKEYGGVIFISWIAVLNSFQHMSVGKQLLAYMQEEGIKNGAHDLQLTADKRNTKYYKYLGWDAFGFEKKGYFGLDEYYMKKQIQEPKEENFLK